MAIFAFDPFNPVTRALCLKRTELRNLKKVRVKYFLSFFLFNSCNLNIWLKVFELSKYIFTILSLKLLCVGRIIPNLRNWNKTGHPVVPRRYSKVDLKSVTTYKIWERNLVFEKLWSVFLDGDNWSLRLAIGTFDIFSYFRSHDNFSLAISLQRRFTVSYRKTPALQHNSDQKVISWPNISEISQVLIWNTL